MRRFLKASAAFFRGGDWGLDPYELAVIDALSRQVSADDGEKLRTQARAINFVQRLDGGRIVYCRIKGRKSDRSSLPQIENLPRTAKYAKVLARSHDQFSRLRAIIYLGRGCLFEINFDKPTKFANPENVDDFKVTILGPPFEDPDETEESAGEWPVDRDE